MASSRLHEKHRRLVVTRLRCWLHLASTWLPNRIFRLLDSCSSNCPPMCPATCDYALQKLETCDYDRCRSLLFAQHVRFYLSIYWRFLGRRTQTSPPLQRGPSARHVVSQRHGHESVRHGQEPQHNAAPNGVAVVPELHAHLRSGNAVAGKEADVCTTNLCCGRRACVPFAFSKTRDAVATSSRERRSIANIRVRNGVMHRRHSLQLAS